MNTTETIETTSDERVMAALAHFFGLIAALIVWATQKDKSRFVKFQALQALAFDALLLIVMMLLTMCMLGVMMLGILAMGASLGQPSYEPGLPPSELFVAMLWPMSMMLCAMPVSLAALLVRILAAVSVASGKNWRYPLIAPRVEAFLGGDPAPGSATSAAPPAPLA